MINFAHYGSHKQHKCIFNRVTPQYTEAPNEKDDGLHHPPDPLHHLRPGRQRQPWLCDDPTWPQLFERGGYEGRGAVALHELGLLLEGVDCACATADAYAWLHV